MAVEKELHLSVARLLLHMLPTLTKVNVVADKMVQELGHGEIKQRNNP